MKTLALAACASFLCIGTGVGLRMLRLARRTRGLPELLLGTGLVSLTFVTLPALALSLGAHVGGRVFQTLLFALGLAPVAGFAVCQYTFTALVFRPGRRWATLLCWLSGLVSGIGALGTVSARLAAWDADRVVGARWGILLIAPFLIGMTWTGSESLVYHLRLRRRVPLGLADPVVCDRFRLWAIGNLGAVAGTAVVVASLALGWRVVQHPVPMLGIAFAGLSLSGAWYLAFLAPPRYLAWVRARATAAG